MEPKFEDKPRYIKEIWVGVIPMDREYTVTIEKSVNGETKAEILSIAYQDIDENKLITPQIIYLTKTGDLYKALAGGILKYLETNMPQAKRAT